MMATSTPQPRPWTFVNGVCMDADGRAVEASSGNEAFAHHACNHYDGLLAAAKEGLRLAETARFDAPEDLAAIDYIAGEIEKAGKP